VPCEGQLHLRAYILHRITCLLSVLQYFMLQNLERAGVPGTFLQWKLLDESRTPSSSGMTWNPFVNTVSADMQSKSLLRCTLQSCGFVTVIALSTYWLCGSKECWTSTVVQFVANQEHKTGKSVSPLFYFLMLTIWDQISQGTELLALCAMCRRREGPVRSKVTCNSIFLWSWLLQMHGYQLATRPFLHNQTNPLWLSRSFFFM
jgi:hypothetical protein